MKFVIEATIPGIQSQFGNLKPRFEVEAPTYKEAEKLGMKMMIKYWDKYGTEPFPRKVVEKKIKDKTKEGFEIVETFTGEKIRYNERLHKYADMDWNPLISATQYKRILDGDTDFSVYAEPISKTYGVPVEIILEMWAASGDNSCDLGNSIHKAMERWFKYRKYGCGEKNYHLSKHPFLLGAVQSFPLKDKEILPEVFVSSVENKMVGQIDGLEVTGEKKCIIHDYKTDGEIGKHKTGHFKQLSFYAEILKISGWTVEELVLWNYLGEWTPYRKTEWEFIPLPTK